jgi:Cu2+-exporting ATPase
LGRAEFCGQPPTVDDVVQVFLADEQGLLARFDLQETVRPGAKALVKQLQRSGLEVQLLSGDRPAPVRALAQDLGLRQDLVRSQCSPQDKLAHLQATQSAGRKVLMLGDGLNDGPVLAQADVSVAVGTSVPLTQAQADIVLPSAQIEALPLLLAQSRRAMAVVRQNLAWAAAYNALCIPLAWMGWLPAWAAGLGMALSSLLVVLNAARLSRSGGLPQSV